MGKHFCTYCMTPVQEGESCPVCGLTSGNYVPSPHHLPPGTVLQGRYLVGRVLGEGGFGITYIGCDLRLELKVAIKEYYPVDRSTRNASATLNVTSFMGLSAKSFERGKQKFLEEARTMARMDKQQVIVGVRDFFEANNTAYIVMEYIEGTTFSDLTEQYGGRIPPRELFRTIEPLFQALAMMHESGLIHRDISPDNLMLENGKVRLLDFGCARETTRGTETLTIALKHGYAPLEQYQQKGQGPWTDIYALCATIYYCLTGKAPPQALDRIAEETLLLPSKLGVELPPHQEAALLRGLAIRPNRRYQTVEELHAALYTEPVVIPEPPDDPDKPEAPEPPEAPSKPEVPDKPDVPETPEIPGTPQPERRDVPLWKRPALWMSVGAAAVVAIALGAALLGNETTPVSSSSASAVSASETEMADVEIDRFKDAETFPGTTEEELRGMLDDENIAAIVLPSGLKLSLQSGELELTKPLLVERGASLELRHNVTVSGEGYLQIDGSAHNMALLRTVDGGAIRVGSSGVLDGETVVWLEHENDLTVDSGGSASMNGEVFGEAGSDDRFLVLCEEELFADAAHVTTWAEFDDAMSSRSVSAIVIDSDLELRLDEGCIMRVPVLISEGVTVTTRRSGMPDARDAQQWVIDGSILINRGSLEGPLNFGDWNGDRINDVSVFVNYGSASGEWYLDCAGALLNYGELTLFDTQNLAFNVFNMGVLTQQGESGESFLNFFNDVFFNAGSLVIKEGYITLTAGLRLYNAGEIVLEGGELRNEAFLENDGAILVGDGASLGNSGYLFGEGGLEFASGSTLGHAGLLEWSGAEPLEFPNSVNNGGVLAVLDRSGARQASTEDELRNALADEACTLVTIDGDLTVNGDLTVTKGVEITDGTLTLSGGGLTLFGENAMLKGTVDLGGGALALSDGAAMAASSLTQCGSAEVTTGAELVVLSSFELNGAPVTLSEGGHMVALRGLRMAQSAVQIESGCVLRCVQDLELLACTIDISSHGELLINNGETVMDEATAVSAASDSFISFGVNHSEYVFRLEGTLNAGGRTEIFTQTEVSGSLTNTGEMRFDQPMRVTGTVDNQGTMAAYYNAKIITNGGGTFTGTAPVSGTE